MSDLVDLRKCKRAPSAGGLSRAEANQLAIDYGLDPSQYKKKNDLCDALIKAAEKSISRTPEAKSPRVTHAPEITQAAPRVIQAPKFPSSLQSLTFGSKFNQPIEKLPNSLTNLELGEDFDQSIKKLPIFLKKLDVNHEFVRKNY